MVGFPKLEPEDECVIQYSIHDPARGQTITQSALKGDQRMFGYYLDVRKRYEATFGPYTDDDYALIKRAT
ncbi:hypothetical protein FUA23_11825 [Neolewinella aurantiaca]|uniref:Uncharacterized protein n=1 Tax=Neolewinella aurantiaca TaxID=2602767 RepID=A0A5C7FS28_9BACT|nr:hypothetical protein [Neolewinella aurantiaca]TXF89193.1 hypothetical protein FUA23_11825 [Neolewinella aurantiaca]